MIKFLEILEQFFRTSSSNYLSGMPSLDTALGRLMPGIYGFIGPEQKPLHLAMQYMQNNDDVSIYYGYVHPPLSAMYRLTAYGLQVPVAQVLINPKAIVRTTSFAAFKLRMRFMNFIDMYETIPVPPVSIARMVKDVESVREKEEQLVVLCIDDFATWLDTSVRAQGGGAGDARRLAVSLRDFCTVYQVIVLAPCRDDNPGAEILTEISNATVRLRAAESGARRPDGISAYSATVSDALGGTAYPLSYNNEMESFADA